MMTRRRSEHPSHELLLALLPAAPNWSIDWPAIWTLWPQLPRLDDCPQDRIHHAEGDVGIHTRMVVEALVADPAWRAVAAERRALLFWAAVLHDIGKPATTRQEDDGRITARGHSRLGAMMARTLLWEAGSPFAWRETICGIIAAHQLPFWLIERENPSRLAIETSWRCRADDLCLHARADANGRICRDQSAVLDNVELARALFEDAGCLSAPFPFANDESRMAFFEHADRDPRYTAHEAFRCTVTVMSGLPGVGKDTWIAANRPGLPVVSLDNIRHELDAPSSGNQGQVIQAAYERAREHLRAGRDFVWNGTNISRLIRGKVLSLLRSYGARIEIVYIETPPDRLVAQNGGRDAAVPGRTLVDLVRKLEPPGRWEGHEVVYVLR